VSQTYWSGRRAADFVDVDLFVNCSRKEAFAGRNGVNTACADGRVRLTRGKWLDDLLATQTSHRGLAAVEGERGSYARFTRPGDCPGTDAGPGLPEPDFVVVGASYEDDGHVLCSLARRLVGNYRRRHGWRSSCKRVRELLRTLTLVWNNLPSDHGHLPSLAAFAQIPLRLGRTVSLRVPKNRAIVRYFMHQPVCRSEASSELDSGPTLSPIANVLRSCNISFDGPS